MPLINATRNRLIIMLKEPRVGTVKTRLGRDIGHVDATWWFRHQTRQLLRNLTDPRWSIHLSIGPDTSLYTRAFPAHFNRQQQGTGTLGQRMIRAFETVSAGPTVLIGSDVPDITPRLITDAFRVLGHKDSVFGPAPDGGYWLIGMKRHPLPPHLFENVRWSTEHALSDTLATMGAATIGYVAQMQDVDTVTDLHAVRDRRNHGAKEPS